MKLKKFYAVTKENTWLHSYLAGVRLIYGFDRGVPEKIREFRDWIRCNLSYVAFRPWESLNMCSQNKKQTEWIGNKGHGLHQITEYEVLWHARDGKCQRAQFAHGTDHFHTSVGQIINWIVTFHVDYPSEVKEIHIDAVIRHQYTHSTVLGDYTSESFEVFLCPTNWALEWMKKDLQLQDRAARKGVRIQGLAA